MSMTLTGWRRLAFAVVLPSLLAGSAYGYASAEPSTTVTMTDPLDDWSRVFERSTHLTLDSSNASFFGGDTSRVKRTQDSKESFTYRRTDISDYSAKVYYWNPNSDTQTGNVEVSVSTDGSSWTPAASAKSSPAAHGSGWYGITYTPTTALPAGINYLRFSLADDPAIFTPQIGEVTLTFQASTPPEPPPADDTLTIHASETLERNFMGFGVQWEPSDSEWEDDARLSDADWNRIFQRVDYMRPGVLRVMLRSYWYAKGWDENGPVYDWNSRQMRLLHRLLDYAKKRKIDVIIGEWDDPAPPRPGPGYPLSDIEETDPRWARIIGDFLHQMRYVKGYTNIKYYNMINEPNGDWSDCGDWTCWSAATANLYRELARRGFLKWIKIIGPDTTQAEADHWVNDTVDRVADRIGAYDVHRYATISDIENGVFERQMRPLRDYISNLDSPDKPFFMGEAGMIDGRVEDTQTRRYDFAYGVWMGDSAVQTMRSGQAGSIAWDLDDAMHKGGGYGSLNLKGWGFWNSYGGRYGYPSSDLDIRPWYYTWSLMSRAFPKGSQSLLVPMAGSNGVRAAAAKIPKSEGKYDLSFAIVNDSDQPATVKLAVPEATAPVTLTRYHYFDADRPADAEGFPVPKAVDRGVELSDGLDVTLPARGMVILTTLEAGKPIPLAEGEHRVTDGFESWSQIADRSQNWAVDHDNARFFAGDLWRIKRTADTPQWVTYARDGLTSFSLTAYFRGAVTGGVQVFTSPDGKTWSRVTLERIDPAPTGGEWRAVTYSLSGAAPENTNYLKIEVSGELEVATPQLATVSLTYG